MKITKKIGCAISILTAVGMKRGETVSVKSIKSSSSFTEPFIRKIIVSLESGGLLESSMGPKGGYRLAKPASKITIGEVFSLIDEAPEIVQCFHAKGCEMEEKCLIDATMCRLNGDIRRIFLSYTIEDFIKGVENGKNSIS